MSKKTKAKMKIEGLDEAPSEQVAKVQETLNEINDSVIPWVGRVKLLESILMFVATKQEHLNSRIMRIEAAYNLSEEDFLAGKKPEVGPTREEQMAEIVGLAAMGKMLAELKETRPDEPEKEERSEAKVQIIDLRVRKEEEQS